MSEHYRRAGVDIDAADRFVERIAMAARRTRRPEVMAGIGGFAAHIDLRGAGYRDPLLVTSTDGVGTKLRVAIEARRLDTIGIDLVAMCVNDLACSGADPLYFLDYFATGQLQPSYHAPIIEGIAAACTEVGCALIGGETAEMPGSYPGTEFDLAGFVIGMVERDQLIDGQRIAPGDVVIGVASTGFHSNGYSLLRKVVTVAGLGRDAPFPGSDRSVGELLLTPTALYSPLVKQLRGAVPVHGIAHITGGGLTGNIPRILPETCQAVLHWSQWSLPAPFAFIQEAAGLSDDELRRVLNCGVGLVVVVPPAAVEAALDVLRCGPLQARVIGEIRTRQHGAEAIEYD